MNLTYDEAVDAAYLKLGEPQLNEVNFTYCCDPNEVGGQIHLDFDIEGHLIGIEILQASKKLPRELLSNKFGKQQS